MVALAEGDAASRMDRMYRHQRHIYDLTRKFYLVGRDALLAELPLAPDLAICEMGCGTGRNLVRLARRAPGARLYGIDVSRAMLASARAATGRAGLGGRIALAQASVAELDAAAAFGVAQFDVVFFSYVLSMLPDWRAAVTRSLALLRPGGTFAAVDFGDQEAASPLRRRALLAWLALFDVHPRREIEHGLLRIAAAQDPALRHRSLGRGYAYRLMFRKPG
jgi:S-adenosylmethionine-diacylgycerolhomoserine-N-methlytransferase